MIRGIGELTNKQKAFVHTKALLARIIRRVRRQDCVYDIFAG